MHIYRRRREDNSSAKHIDKDRHEPCRPRCAKLITGSSLSCQRKSSWRDTHQSIARIIRSAFIDLALSLCRHAALAVRRRSVVDIATCEHSLEQLAVAERRTENVAANARTAPVDVRSHRSKGAATGALRLRRKSDANRILRSTRVSALQKGSLPSGAPNDEDASRPLSRLSISYDRASAHVCVDTLSLENLHLLDGYASNNSGDSISFYCRFRLLPEKRSLFQTKVARCTRLQSSYLFDKKQLSEFELAHEQLNHHAIEIFVYKISSVKPLYRDVRLATIKYDLNELSQSDQSRMKKTFEDCDPASITQVREAHTHTRFPSPRATLFA